MALALIAVELVVRTLPEPPKPKPKPPPAPADAESPRPTEGSTPRLMPEDPTLMPTPRLTPAETDAPTDAERLTPRIGLLEGPTPTPPLTPTPGFKVALATTHPFRTFPPLVHVPVMGMLVDVGMVTRVLRLEDGIVRGFDIDDDSTPTPTPTVTETPTVAETLTLGRSEVKPGTVDSRDVTPPTAAAGT